ncbi:MAG: hypothetical protein MZV63_54420 [Marinilabiliales bacterium]|nr:hypothetical protein [Marinilabiliales bacterium]
MISSLSYYSKYDNYTIVWTKKKHEELIYPAGRGRLVAQLIDPDRAGDESLDTATAEPCV